MGIASSIENVMEKNTEKMMVKQTDNQRLMQERMRRQMVAQTVAMTRERFWWMAAFAGFAYTGAFVNIVKKQFPPALAPPLVIYAFILAYTWDLAYGNKMERINRMAEEMVANEPHWFTPVYPTESQMKHLKDVETKSTGVKSSND